MTTQEKNYQLKKAHAEYAAKIEKIYEAAAPAAVEKIDATAIYDLIVKANSLDVQMTIEEAASYLNLSRITIRKRIKAGKIKTTSYGKQFRINKAQFHTSI
tara:strand:+ start:2096 stop:2398 length:303 start_codon:yes stop_codon:yes gene_type:complete